MRFLFCYPWWLSLTLCFSLTGHAQLLQQLGDKQIDTPELSSSLAAVAQAGYVYEPVFNSRMYLLEAGLEHRETVVLVHGLGQNGYRDWRTVIPALAQHYHVLAMDLPGFGLSQKPNGRYSPTQYARLLQWLISQSGRERVYLVGHSMGGAVALRYAATFPDTLHGVVLVSVAGVLQRSAFLSHSSARLIQGDGTGYIDKLPVTVKTLADGKLRDWGSRLLSFAEGLSDPLTLLYDNDTAWSLLLGNRPNMNAALALIDEDFTQALKTIQVPTLIIWGEQDPIAPPRTGVLLEEQLVNARRVTFANVGHVPMGQTQRFNELLLSFLSQPSITPSKPAPSLGGAKLMCRNLRNQYYSGVFTKIELHNCDGAILENIRADAIYIKDSDVHMRNVSVQSDRVALHVEQSRLSITNGQLIGRQAIVAAHSHLDLAGVTVHGHETAVKATGPSTFVFSVSHVQGPSLNRGAHGVFRLGYPQ